MKRIIALLMAVLMAMSMAACGGNENSTTETTVPSTTVAEPETVGEKLLSDFMTDTTGTPQAIADRLLTNEVIEFMGAAMPVEEGLLSGFDNAEIKGFKEGVMFAPMMSSIAFVGYIFELEDGADVESFKTTLKESANLRWNICVEADELICESDGNKVFFLMCPENFEEPDAEGGDAVADEGVPEDDMVIAAEDGDDATLE